MRFPFDIYNVADKLSLEMRRQHAKSSDYDCPFCGGKGKLNLNVELNTYRCNKCGLSGGMLDLFCNCTGIQNRKEAYKILAEKDNRITAEIRKKREEKVSSIKEASKADVQTLDRVYTALLDILELKSNHRKDLFRRGLSSNDIYLNRYKSVPVEHPERIISMMIEQGFNLIGVPGFYVDENGEIQMNVYNFMDGYFVPVYNSRRQIRAMQIRLDNPLDGKRKYMWLSSSEKTGGCSSNSPADICGDLFNSEVIYITEGPLKGQTAHALSGKPFISIAGVSQMKELDVIFKALHKKGKCCTIVDAMDTDDDVNEHVRQAHINLAWLAKNNGFIPRRLTWDRAYKGIDDYLLAVKEKKGEKNEV